MRIIIYGCEKDEEILFQKYSQLYGAEIKIIKEPISVENAFWAKGNKCVSVSHKTEITLPILESLKTNGVEYVSTRSIGINHIDIKAAERLGICIDNVAYSPNSVADFTIMLMLMGLRNIDSVLRRADAQNFTLTETRGKELRDMTVGVLGTGRIGQAVIERLKGFGCRILAFDNQEKIKANYASLDEVLKKSDIVTLHMPLNTATRHILDCKRIENIKDGALIINTGRGALIDTKSLIQALASGKLGGAALDVVEGEEGIFYNNCEDSIVQNKQITRLQEMDNVTITPHIAFYTEHALWDVVENTIKNCLAYEGGNEKWVS